jgi:hypothetical protein
MLIIEGIEYKRAELGVDGNAGFALLGPDIQAGEAEFVTLNQREDELLSIAERRAAKQALSKLRERLDMPNLSYYIGSSYPGHC